DLRRGAVGPHREMALIGGGKRRLDADPSQLGRWRDRARRLHLRYGGAGGEALEQHGCEQDGEPDAAALFHCKPPRIIAAMPQECQIAVALQDAWHWDLKRGGPASEGVAQNCGNCSKIGTNLDFGTGG